MVSSVKQIVGLALAAIGLLGSIIICALPEWMVMSSGTTVISWNGLWKICAALGTQHVQCLTYPSEQFVPPGIKEARALVVIAILLGFFGIGLGVVGAKCINEDQERKRKVTIVGGILFIIAGLMVFSSVCNFTRIIYQVAVQNVISSQPSAVNIQSGAALYIGWITAGLLFLGGGLLCSCCCAV